MKVRDIIKKKKELVQLLILTGEAAAGFVFSGEAMKGTSGFADISIAGAAGLAGSASVFMGSLLRCFADESIGRNIVKLAALVMIIIVKLLTDKKSLPVTCGIYTAVSVFLSGIAVSAVIGELAYKLIFYLFYSAAAGFTAYSICRIVLDAENGNAIELTSASGCYYALVYTIYTASLCSVRLPFFDPGIVVGITVTMLAAFYYGSTGGGICGALTACAAYLSSPDAGMEVVLLPAAGLFSGFVRRRRITVSVLIFIGISFMLTVLSGINGDLMHSIADHLVAAGLFMIVAPYYSDRHIRVQRDIIKLNEIVRARLSFLSDSLISVASETNELAERMLKKKETVSVKTDDTEEVCGGCYRKHICRRQGSSTMKGLETLSAMAEVSLETFPAELDTCIKRNELLAARQKGINEETLSKIMDMRMSDCRSLMSEQFTILDELLKETAQQQELYYSAPVSRTVRDKLIKFGYDPEYVNACYNSKGRLIAEIYFQSSESNVSATRICDLISDEIGVKLVVTEPVNSGNEIRLRMFEKPAINLEVCTSARKGNGTDESGDTFHIFGDGTGTGYIVLSDGMGSGKEAAFESSLASGLFRRLISCGVGGAAAFRLINSIMFSKSKDESFATLDVLIADLDKGEITSVKSGAAATMIRHKGNIICITSDSFPVGMYEEADITERVCDFEEGDIAIMFSDGICEGEYRFIRELLLGDNDLRTIVDEICAKSDKFSPFNKTDDVTVIGVRAVSA